MNNKFNMELVSRVLLMPYIDSEFNDKNNDVIYGLVTGYHKLCKENDARKYRKAIKALECYRFDDVQLRSIDDIKMLTEIFYPVAEMSYLYGKKHDAVNEYYINRIFQIASNFITFRDGRVAIRLVPDNKGDDIFSGYRTMNKIELWNTITRIVPTDVFIAAHFINSGICSEDDMRVYFVNVPTIVELSDKLLKEVLKTGIAENHLHMNAGISYSLSWKKALDWNAYNNKDIAYLREAFFQMTFAEYLEDAPDEDDFMNYLKQKEDNTLAKAYYEMCCHMEYEARELYNNIVLEYNYVIEEYFASFNKENDETRSIKHDNLKRTVYKKYDGMGTDTELIFLYKALVYLRKRGKNDCFAKENFLKYLRAKNQFFSDKLQSNKVQGLEYFSGYYARATRLNISSENMYASVFGEQCKNDVLKKLEVRIMPKVLSSSLSGSDAEDEIKWTIIKNVRDVLRSYISTMQHELNRCNENIVDVGIVYHFRKATGEDNFSGRKCILKKQTFIGERGNDYYEMREIYGEFVRTLNKTLIEYPILAKYIVGLDAASVENATEPWVLAPVFRDSRIREETRPVDPNSRKYIHNIGLTYHVGEDFRHIISGLRHIDEVIENFGYMSGDRIGHAVALGIDAHKLIGVNKIVCMPIIEYLDNLLWMWGIVHGVDLNLESDIGGIEYKIMNTAREIYGDDLRNIDVFMLREAYDKKFNHLNERQKQLVKDGMDNIYKNKYCGNRFCMLDKIYDGLWDADKLVCTYYCPCYYRIYNKPIFVELSERDAFIIEQLQKHIIRKIESKGIYVETNPTSNTAITEVDSIMNHPILRLNNLGLDKSDSQANSVMVTINSDDSMIFSTNVENELAMIYHSLVYHGYSREKVLRWIDKIRENGMTSSFVNDLGTMKDIQDDYKKINGLLEI